MKSLNTPWHFDYETRDIFNCEGVLIGEMEHADDSKYVVRAVNCHDELLTALNVAQEALAREGHSPDDSTRSGVALKIVWDAIDKAEQLQ